MHCNKEAYMSKMLRLSYTFCKALQALFVVIDSSCNAALLCTGHIRDKGKAHSCR